MAAKLKPGGPGSLHLSLGAPGMTPMHRTGLAGLAMALLALDRDKEGAEARALGGWEVTQQSVTLTWTDDGDGFLRAVTRAALRVDNDGFIWFPALGRPSDDLELAVHLQRAMLGTFLQHPSARKARQKKEAVRTHEIDEKTVQIRYLPLTSFIHQLSETDRPTQPRSIAGWLYPGGVVRHTSASKDTELVFGPELAVPLLFTAVGAIFFEVHRQTLGRRPTYCLALPDVLDLIAYAEAREIFSPHSGVQILVAAGTGEAAIRVLAEFEAHKFLGRVVSDRCAVIGFGTVAWSSQQKTRIECRTIEGIKPDGLRVYQIASHVMPARRVRSAPDKETGVVMQWWSSPQTPELVATNIARGVPWWRGFSDLWRTVRDSLTGKQREWALVDERKGLFQMVQQAMPDSPEQRFVRACHEAWRRRLGELGDRSRTTGTPFKALRDREFERTRIAFARCKSPALFRQTLTDYWSRAGVLSDLRDGWPELLPFIQTRWQEGRDLALLALASYRGADRAKDDGDTDDTDSSPDTNNEMETK